MLQKIREEMIYHYKGAKATNDKKYQQLQDESSKERPQYKGLDDRATREYVFPNQIYDALAILDIFFRTKARGVSVQKKTKTGADGLMIEIAKLFATHEDDRFMIDPANMRIITGMSNCKWEGDFIDRAPECLRKNVFHHGKLQTACLENLRNALIFIDEIDCGDKEFQVLHKTLRDAGLLNIKHMEEHNNRFVLISATMIKELYDLHTWGDSHRAYKMTIPDEYIGHKDFLDMGIVQPSYPLTVKTAGPWVQTDIVNKYEKDYRVHFVRVTKKTIPIIKKACKDYNVAYEDHNSEERSDIEKYFSDPLHQHVVIGIKGFYRRANFFPNRWKLRIGATHELCTKNIDNNVQIQGLTGRMTGYWRKEIEAGHMTGPHRMSTKAVEEYENIYNDFFGDGSYQTAKLKKSKNKVTASQQTLYSSKHVGGAVPQLLLPPEDTIDINTYRIYDKEDTVRKVFRQLGYHFVESKEDSDGFKKTSLRTTSRVISLDEAVKYVPMARGGGGGGEQSRRYYPCYLNTSDRTTLLFVVIIEPTIASSAVEQCDEEFPPILFRDCVSCS